MRYLILIAVSAFASFFVGAASYGAAVQGLLAGSFVVIGVALSVALLFWFYNVAGAIMTGGSHQIPKGVTLALLFSPFAAAILGGAMGAAEQGAT